MKKSLLFALIITILTACDGPSLLSPCGGKDEFWGGSIWFGVFDRQDPTTSLLGLYGRYNAADFSVSDSLNNVVLPGPAESTGRVSLRYLNRDTDQAAYNRPLTKQYYLHLDQTDTDTLTITFQVRRDKCDKNHFESVRVLYNDSLYYQGSGVGIGASANSRLPFLKFYK